jgi:hypothetical protein
MSNSEIFLNEEGEYDVGGIHLVQDRYQWRGREGRNELSDIIKRREFLDCLRNYRLLNRYSSLWV